MMRPFLTGALAASFLVSCGGSPTTSGTYECGVTCSVGGVEMSASAPYEEMAASQPDAVAACMSTAQMQVATICGSASATVACVCDLTM